MNVALYGEHVIMDAPAAQWVHGLGVPVGAIEVNSKAVYALPFNSDTHKIFSNMGVQLPSLIEGLGYDFPGPFRPYRHQIATTDFLAHNDRAFVLSSPGTGKSASAIWAADHLLRQGTIDRVLVLCPMSCMHSVWSKEIFTLTPGASQVVLHGPSETRLKLFEQGAKWNIINHDGLRVPKLAQAISADDSGVGLVIIDESTAFKSPSAVRTKALLKSCKGRRAWAMTGTPIPLNPVDAFTMCRLINPDAPQHKYQFQDATMIKVNKFKWVSKPEATEKLYSFMQPAIRFDKADCLDMPDVVKIDRQIPLTKEQDKLIKELKDEWVADTEAGQITAVNAAARIGKMLQVCQGAVRTGDDDKAAIVDCAPRHRAALDAVNESSTKTIIFATFRAPIPALEKYLTDNGVSVAVVTGQTSSTERTRIFSDFQNQPNPKVLLAHPATVSHGLTLTAASTTIWFGPTNKPEVYTQANNRTDRPGQKHDMRIIHLFGPKFEEKVYRSLENSENQQDMLLELYREEVE